MCTTPGVTERLECAETMATKLTGITALHACDSATRSLAATMYVLQAVQGAKQADA